MFENRSLKLDLCALVLVAGVAFLAASLWTYDRFDPPSTLVDPPRRIRSQRLRQSPARSRPTSCSRASASARTTCSARSRRSPRCCSMRREIDQPMLRAVGWIVSLVGLTTLAALSVPNWTPGPVIGSGGYVGAMGRGLLEMHFAKTGAFIFTLSVLAAGSAAGDRLLPVPGGRRDDQRLRPLARPHRPLGQRRRETQVEPREVRPRRRRRDRSGARR